MAQVMAVWPWVMAMGMGGVRGRDTFRISTRCGAHMVTP